MSASVNNTTIDSQTLTKRPQDSDLLPEIDYKGRLLQRLHVLSDPQTWMTPTLPLLLLSIMAIVLMARHFRSNCPMINSYLWSFQHLIMLGCAILMAHMALVHAFKRLYARFGTAVDATIVGRLYACESGWSTMAYQFFTDRGEPMQYAPKQCQMQWTELDRRSRCNNRLGGLLPNLKIYTSGSGAGGGLGNGTSSNNHLLMGQTTDADNTNTNTFTNTNTNTYTWNQTLAESTIQQEHEHGQLNEQQQQQQQQQQQPNADQGTITALQQSNSIDKAEAADGNMSVGAAIMKGEFIQAVSAPSHHVLVEFRWQSKTYRKWYRVNDRTYAVEISTEVILPPGSAAIAALQPMPHEILNMPMNLVPHFAMLKQASKSPYKMHIPYFVLTIIAIVYWLLIGHHVSSIECQIEGGDVDEASQPKRWMFYASSVLLVMTIWIGTGWYVSYWRELFDFGPVTEMETSAFPQEEHQQQQPTTTTTKQNADSADNAPHVYMIPDHGGATVVHGDPNSSTTGGTTIYDSTTGSSDGGTTNDTMPNASDASATMATRESYESSPAAADAMEYGTPDPQSVFIPVIESLPDSNPSVGASSEQGGGNSTSNGSNVLDGGDPCNPTNLHATPSGITISKGDGSAQTPFEII